MFAWKYWFSYKFKIWHMCVLCNLPSKYPCCEVCLEFIDCIDTDICCPRCLNQYVPGVNFCIDYLDNSCVNCLDKKYDNIICKFTYTKPLSAVLHKLKYGLCAQYALALSFIFYQASRALAANQWSISNYDVIIPVPLSKNKHKVRKFNQSLLLLFWIYQKIPSLPSINTNIIRRKIDSKPQIFGNKDQRLRNVDNAFSINHDYDVSNLRILLVDDVVTTGHTINSIAKLLKSNQAVVVDCLCLMRAI